MRRGFLGLGSNEGDRGGALAAVPAALADRGVEVVGASSLWETAAQGEVTDQADFLNACLEVRTALGPEELLAACKEIEREGGRAGGGPRHAPRPIDVDVLLLGGLEHRSERLTLPHPEISTRRFVIEPLLELDPDLLLPDGTPVAGLLEGVHDQRVERAGPWPG